MREPKHTATSDPVFRYRVRFGKHGLLRWIGHLDLQKAWERTLVRADVPMHMAKGFHPRPRFAFAAPLPLGFTSDGELVDVWLSQHRGPDALQKALADHTPPGLCILSVELVRLEAPSLGSLVQSAQYAVTLSADQCSRLLESRALDRVNASTTLPRERRGRQYDLRPLIEDIDFRPAESKIRLQLAAREGATGRPEELILACDLDPAESHIHREHLLLR